VEERWEKRDRKSVMGNERTGKEKWEKIDRKREMENKRRKK
jgi:hypothetical protein